MQTDMYKDVHRKLLAIMILVPLIPFVAALGIGYNSYEASMRRAAQERAERIAGSHAALIESFLNERKTDLDVILATVGHGQLASTQRLESILSTLQRASLAFIDLGLINAQGVQLAYAGPFELTGKNYAQAHWFRETCSNGSFVSNVYMGYRHQPHFVVAVMLRQHGRKWVLRATVDQALFGDLVEGVSIGTTGEAYIVNNLGELQTARRSGGALLEKSGETVSDGRMHMMKNDDPQRFIRAVVPLNNGMWRLVVRQNEAEALQELDWAAMCIAVVSLAGGAFILVLAFTISNRLVHMLRSKEHDRVEMETHLMRAARLAELGEMSAGFAHEINNPLQIMKSEIALMEMEADEAGKGEPITGERKAAILDGLDQLGRQIDRCAAITRSILKFGRHSGPEVTTVNLSEFLPELCEMVKRKAAVSGIEFSCSIPGDTPSVSLDAGQLQQVVLNLMNNAIQAIEERHDNEGGQLKVAAHTLEDGRVRILVQDNGNGIRPENIEKIFNPFFTTKPPGKGTGLGLSICHAIIDAMGGVMEVSSEHGQGTVFTITLPAITVG
ncbi:sensor histidine kinase [Pseudodesulfovibrio senegalensis]|uniref:sensor histidine kinase n=1 Tax=Pseudodesulfovibrio senegalensis TaxID=1721087 RepID=UPI001375F414|nr:ATP-binding protein [Pseudodesulfovibrio senegalensis]